jgi:hypothetical protein
MKYLILISFLLINNYYNIQAQTTSKDATNSMLKYNASVAGKSDGLITIEEILSAKQLLLDKDAEQSYRIISFKITIICKGRDPIEIENQKNGELNSKMIEGIKKTSSGCKLLFEYIKAIDNTNHLDAVKYVKPLSFTIK